jgi:hypothetical protein
MGIHEPSKDETGSNRLKYNRRLERLRHSLEQFLIYSDFRLNPSDETRVNKKEQIERIHSMSQELLEALPIKKEDTSYMTHENFLRMMDAAEQDMQEFRKTLGNDDTDYLKSIYEFIEESKKKYKDEDENT